MFEMQGRITIGALLAVVLAVGLGSGLNAAVPNTSPTAVVTPGHCWTLTYNMTDGRILSLGSACETLVAQPDVGSLNLTSGQTLSTMYANGWINAFYVNLQTHQVTQIPGVTFSSDYQQAFYNGQLITNGTVLPNPYTSLTTPTSNINACNFGLVQSQQIPQIHIFLIPLNGSVSANGTVFLKVVQNGANATGVVFVTHRISSSDWQGSASYCEFLDQGQDNNASGFMQVTDYPHTGDSLPQSGVYNFTVATAYLVNNATMKAGIPFTVAIPGVAVMTGTATYITLSIPSGEVTVTVCGPGNSCSTTTTTINSKGS